MQGPWNKPIVDPRPFSVRLLREELQLLHEPGSYVGEVVKIMGKNKVLVKVQPEGKYSERNHNIMWIMF